MKRNYKVTLNYEREVTTWYRYAFSKEQALQYAVNALERKLGLVRGALTNYFKQDTNNREIVEVKE